MNSAHHSDSSNNMLALVENLLQFLLFLLESVGVALEHNFRFPRVQNITRDAAVLIELVVFPVLFSPLTDLFARKKIIVEVGMIFYMLLHGAPVTEKVDM